MSDAGMDFFQCESRRLRALADVEPTAEHFAQVREALASKYQGIQSLAAAALAAWIRRERRRPERQRRRALGRKPIAAPEAAWMSAFRLWVLRLHAGWWQSFSHAARLLTDFVSPEDLEDVLELYMIYGRPFDWPLRQLPPERCIARLKEIAVSSAEPVERHRAEFALRFFEFEGKKQFHEERRKTDPDPREYRTGRKATHDRRVGLARPRRWS